MQQEQKDAAVPTVHEVPFYEDTLLVLEDQYGGRFVVMKPIVETLGLDWRAQYQRLQRDEVLSEGVTTMLAPSLGGEQEATVLPLELFHGWLFTIGTSRVAPEIKDKLLTYKRECFDVLYNYFHKGLAVNPRFHTIEYSLKPRDLFKVLAENRSHHEFSDLVKNVLVRASESFARTEDGLYFLGRACPLYKACQDDCKALIGQGVKGKAVPMKRRKMQPYADLLVCVFDSGVALHKDEIHALLGTPDFTPVIDDLREQGYWINKVSTNVYKKAE